METRPHVGFIITKAEVGGAQRWSLDQIQLLQDDLAPHLICGDAGWLTDAHTGESMVLNAMQKRLPSLTGLLKLRRYLVSHNIQTLVASSANAGIYARLVKLLLPELRVVYVSHGWSAIYNGGKLAKLYALIERTLSRFTDLILNVSKADEMKCAEHIRISAEKQITILNRTPRPANSYTCPPAKPLRLLYLGRLAHPKRPDLLISAVQQFSSDEVQLTVIGDGPQRKTLELLKYDNVHFMGEIKGFNHYHEHHALCLISDSEGLPMSALEAKAAGIPLLMSDVGGCAELIRPEKPNGLLCGNEPNEIHEAIQDLITSQNEYLSNAQDTAKDAWLEPHREAYLAAYLPQTDRDHQ